LTAALAAHEQSPSLDSTVELFDIDATPLGGPIYHIVSSEMSDNAIVWQGNSYAPVPFEASGFEVNGKGTLPTPRLKVANVNLAFSAVAITYGDLLGCIVTRHRTWLAFLDGQPDADPTAEHVETYEVKRKVTQNKLLVEWELGAKMDVQGVQIPGRIVLQDACTHLYRRFVGGTFDYSKTTCPYTGTNYFDANGAVTTIDQDRCSKRIATGCKLRFPHQPLPTRAFPGVARV
jgi:lambda family phage minor tail protein L